MNKGIHHDTISTALAESAITGARFVKYGTLSGSAVPCGAGEQAYGVAPFDIAANAYGPVVECGVVEVDCAGNITINTLVKSDADGKAVAASTTNIALGVALDTGAASTKIRVKLMTESLSKAP